MLGPAMVPPPAGLSPLGWQVAGLAAAMALLWITEAIPLPVTALLPALVLPLAGLDSVDAVVASYASPILLLVLGGAMVARAIERTGLHRRLALGVVRWAPRTERGLVAAFAASAASVSMLVSNTATALILLPVALGVLRALEQGPPASQPSPGLGPALVLAVAWGATVGGLGTLVGSPTNAVAAGIASRALGTPIDFLTWLRFGLPLVALAVPLVVLVITRHFRVPEGRPAVGLGPGLAAQAPLSPAERRLIPVMALLLVGWVVLPLAGPPLGLADVPDFLVAAAAGLLLFVTGDGAGGRLLDARDVPHLPWDILALFGGGLALAQAISSSGLADWAGQRLGAVGDLPPLLLTLLVVGLVVLATEFASNVATASGLVPVVAVMALEGPAASLALSMAAGLAASWGFMMPAGTPPNALALATGRVGARQLARAGFVVDMAGIPLIAAVAFLGA
ncbi:MAG: DASS family sodium-coupled anion symporter [Sphingomonadaceae bacterium]|nr:DASS family sodium-coupled anion symporter [Sphingomonadaceae bacterium]MDW8415513.1 DASS family sodium-coupled anion symporter [Thermaurantiacus sp.]